MKPVDLVNVDLGEAVTIEKHSAEVYDDEALKDRKPKRGEKLNNPAIIKLFMEVKANSTDQELEKYEDKLIKCLSKKAKEEGDDSSSAAKHVRFDKQNLEWTFVV